MVEQSSAATRSLSSEANILIGIVETFRTRDVPNRPQVLAEPARARRSSAADPARGPARPRAVSPEQPSQKFTPAASPTPLPQRKPAPVRMAAPATSNVALKAEPSGDWSEF